jgi:membrane protein implicated in regulation of membrane protease activity
MSVPVLRILGGVSLVLAGLFAYFHLILGPAVFLLFILAGAVVIAVTFSGHRAHRADVAIFVFGILVLGAATAGYRIGTKSATFSATTTQVGTDRIDLSVAATTGSVSIFFENRSNLAYQVNISESFGGFSIPLAPGQGEVTNYTKDGVFGLHVNSSFSSIDVFLRQGYFVNISATTDTGSVSLTAGESDRLGSVSLLSSTGSLSATVDTSTIQSLDLRTEAGSISLQSDDFETTGHNVPVTLWTSLGSVSVSLDIPNSVAASLTATTGLGSISHQLTGFSVSQNTPSYLAAATGNIATSPYSFVISSSTSLGSQSISIER